MKHLLLQGWFGCMLFLSAGAQNYPAIQGSSFAGALGAHDNPASIVGTPYKWDVVLFGVQAKTSTNAYTIVNYSLLSSPANSLYRVAKGQFARKGRVDLNIDLLNVRIRLNQKSSIAFGAAIRSYTNLKTSSYNFIDTLRNPSQFLNINPDLNNINARAVSSSWMEAWLAYARTIFDNEAGRLNAGVTVHAGRGLSGGYANINNLAYTQTTQNNRPVFTINAADFVYGYSANFDRIQKTNSGSQNFNGFLSDTKWGASVDAGIEYLVKPQGTSGFNDDDDYYDYDWKIGLSVLDVGGYQYQYGTQSRLITGVNNNITNTTLDTKFRNPRSTAAFNDSLASIASASQVNGKFLVLNPTRLLANVDRYLTGNFYLNASLSINIPLTFIQESYQQVKSLNLLTITPRWETRRYGLYLPIQYNTQNQFWVGGAFKAGPLLFGLHNLANLFSKTSVQNGGGYIALIFRAPRGGNSGEGKRDRRLDCPKPVW